MARGRLFLHLSNFGLSDLLSAIYEESKGRTDASPQSTFRLGGYLIPDIAIALIEQLSDKTELPAVPEYIAHRLEKTVERNPPDNFGRHEFSLIDAADAFMHFFQLASNVMIVACAYGV